MKSRRLVGVLVAAACGAFLLGGAPGSQRALAAPVPACTAAQLVPGLGSVTINQGLPYARLARAKETLVRFFLTKPSACAGTISVTAATLSITGANGETLPAGIPAYQSFGAGASIPGSTPSANSNADPLFVVPAARVNPCLVDLAAAPGSCTTAGDLTFRATVTYFTSLSSAPTSLEFTLLGGNPITATVEKQTNALRILVIPMGDATVAYDTQFTLAAQAAVQNGMSTLSRMLPVPGGTGVLGGTGGIRYTINLAAMLNLKAIANTYVSGKFCGTGSNWNDIKGQLAQFLGAWNTANPGAQADRVLGVVDSTISSGSSSNCAEGMASLVSGEGWVRAIPDTTGRSAQPSMTGSLAAMELGHTFGLVPLGRSASRHSANVQADGATPDRGYNVVSRSQIPLDKTTMKLDTSTSPWNNNVTLMEPLDFAYALCALGGATNSECTGAGTAGTNVSVAAGPSLVLRGSTDGTPAGTKITSYYATSVELTPLPAASDYHVVQLVKTQSGYDVLSDLPVPVPFVDSEHDEGEHAEGSQVGAVSVAVDSALGDRVELRKGTDVLYRRDRQAADPIVSTFRVDDGGETTITKTLVTPVIAPTPDIYFLADTTGSMGTALANVQTNATNIIDTVKSKTTNPRFGAGDYKDFPAVAANPYAFNNAAPISASDDGGAAAVTAINAWATAPGQGSDGPEGHFYALQQLATGAAGFRAGSTPIVVLFGDAPSHDPICAAVTGTVYSGPDITESSVTTALRSARVKVLAVSITTGEYAAGLDDDPTSKQFDYNAYCSLIGGSANQASRIATATAGFHKTNVDYATVADAILSGLQNLPATVSPEVTCDPGLSIVFGGDSEFIDQTVTSGEPVTFTERLVVGEGATGTLTCTIIFKVNGEQVRLANGDPDPAFVQTITKTVGATPIQADVSVEAISPVANLLDLDLIYDCDTYDYVAFAGLDPSQVSGTIASWNAAVDTRRVCGDNGGEGTLTAVLIDGIVRVDADAPIPAPQETVESERKSPVAAVYAPTQDRSITPTTTLALNGSGVDPEDGVLGNGVGSVEWFISGPGSCPSAALGQLVGSTPSVDVSPIGAGGRWAIGDYTVRHRVTDRDGNTNTAVSCVHVITLNFLGFLEPIDPLPTLNAGKAGRTYPVKWQIKDASGNFVSALDVVVGTLFREIQCPAGDAVDTLETTASGGSSLRYDTGSQTYVYNWAAPSKPGCYVFELLLRDGSVHEAHFKLTK